MSKEPTLLEQIERDMLASQPLADTLRKCVVLGGKAGSVELREWAIRELRGYDSENEAPDYRTVGAPILVDAAIGNAIVKGQQIGVSSLPDPFREKFSEQYTLLEGIGKLEDMAARADTSENGAVNLSFPAASEIAFLMDNQLGDPSQQITALYWSVSGLALHGVVDQVRTTLAELVVEMRAGTPPSLMLPTARVANHAANVAVHGKNNRVTVQSGQASEGSSVGFKIDDDEQDSPLWTTSRRVAAFVAGLASIAGVALTVAQVRGWI